MPRAAPQMACSACMHHLRFLGPLPLPAPLHKAQTHMHLLPHRFAHAYMTQFPFFKLWPDAVQRELARVLLTEVRVCHETIIARATPLTKVFFLLRGTVSAAGREGREGQEGKWWAGLEEGRGRAGEEGRRLTRR